MPTLTATEARSRFSKLLKEAEREVVQITQRNKPAAAVMSWEIYESLMETVEILSDDAMLDKIRRGEEDVAAGNVISFEQVKKELKR